MSGMTFQPGDVVLIPFPFSDHAATKRRPVLVLTSPDQFEDIVCLAITSSGHHSDGFPLEAGSFSEGALPKASWIRLGKAYTLNADIITGTFGTLKNDVFQQIRSRFCLHFGCQNRQ